MTTNDAWNLLYKLHEAIEEAEDGNINMDCITSDTIDALNYGLFGLDLANHYLDTVIRLVSTQNLESGYGDSAAEELIAQRANKLAQKASDVAQLLMTINKAVNMIDDLTEGGRQ